MSNVLEVRLPLDVSRYRYPPVKERVDEEDLYQEYIEIAEGSGYIAAMDGKSLIYTKIITFSVPLISSFFLELMLMVFSYFHYLNEL